MVKVLNLLSGIFLAAVSSTSVISCGSNSNSEETSNINNFDQIYVLGDSLSDVGSLMGAATDFLSQQSQFSAKSLQFSQIDNKDVYYNNNEFGTGPNAVQHVAVDLGLNLTAGWSFNLSSLKIPGTFSKIGNDYAVGGSQARDTSGLLGAFSLSAQLNALITQHAVNGKLNSNDLVIVESGNNDLFAALGITTSGQTTPSSNQMKIADDAVASEKTVIDGLISAGVSHILVTNVADLSSTPWYLKNDHAVAQSLTNYYNDNWDAMMASEMKANNNKIKSMDLYSFFNQEISIAASLGMNTTDQTVNADISEKGIETAITTNNGNIAVTFMPGQTWNTLKNNFFLDYVHPTEWMQNKVGSALYNLVNQKW